METSGQATVRMTAAKPLTGITRCGISSMELGSGEAIPKENDGFLETCQFQEK